MQELSRYWALPELFEDDGTARRATTEPAEGYHEIHCHLRGGVPYLHLWKGWLDNERWRASLRTLECRSGPWTKTWAELVTVAAAWQAPTGVPQTPIAHILQTCVDPDPPPAGAHVDSALRHLAVCAGLRRFLMHQRGLTGLSVFTRAYDRYSKVQKIRGTPTTNHEQRLVIAVLERFEQDGAVAVELRPTLELRRRDLQRKLTDIILGYFHYLARASDMEDRRPVAMGLVPSLFKQELIRRDGDPPEPDFWERQVEVWCHQIRLLLAVIREVPALGFFIVGLDAAGKERGCPPRALRPAFELIREYNRDHGVGHSRPGRGISLARLRELLAAPGGAQQDEDERAARVKRAFESFAVDPRLVIRLGITVHAGEDFVDPLTGLRHIWETLTDLDLGLYDRIGHALAAGLPRDLVRGLLERRAREPGGEVQQVGASHYRLSKPRGTHLLDLAWVHDLLAGDPAQPIIAAELAAVAAGAFGAPVDPVRLCKDLVARRPAVRPFLPGVRFGDPTRVLPEDRLWVQLDDAWFSRFEILRRRVLREIARRRVVVESCPTSNCAVAGMREAPLAHLAKELPDLCAVATDDPGLLGAWPCDELGRDVLRNDPDLRAAVVRAAAGASFIWPA